MDCRENARSLTKNKCNDANWQEINDELICLDCLNYKNDLDMPSRYKSSLSGHQGVLSMNQSKNHMKSAIENHVNSSIHQWCHNKSIIKSNQEIKQKK